MPERKGTSRVERGAAAMRNFPGPHTHNNFALEKSYPALLSVISGNSIVFLETEGCTVILE